jgi:hypothetical protein
MADLPGVELGRTRHPMSLKPPAPPRAARLGRSRRSNRVPCLEMTRALVTDRIVGVAGAIAAGIGLWRFTSGAWIQGIVFAVAVASIVAYTLLRDRRRGRDTRRY